MYMQCQSNKCVFEFSILVSLNCFHKVIFLYIGIFHWIIDYNTKQSIIYRVVPQQSFGNVRRKKIKTKQSLSIVCEWSVNPIHDRFPRTLLGVQTNRIKCICTILYKIASLMVGKHNKWHGNVFILLFYYVSLVYVNFYHQ